MLAPQLEAEPEDPLLELGLAAREHYGPLADALRETTGSDIGLWREGIAWVAGDEAEAGGLWSKVAWQRQQGHLADWLDAEEVKSRWPWLGPTHGALWAPHEGAVEPERLVAALRQDCGRLGVAVEQDAAVAVESRGERVTGVLGQRRPLPGRGCGRGRRRLVGDDRRGAATHCGCAGARADGGASLASRDPARDRLRPGWLSGRSG